MGLRISLLLARALLRITLLRIALLPLRRAGLNWRRRRGHAGLRRLTTRRGDRRFARHRHLAAAKRTRCARGVGVLARVEGIAAAPAAGRWRRLFLHDGRGRGDLRLLVVAPLGRRITLLLAGPLLRISLLRIALLSLWRTGLNRGRSRGHAGLRDRRLAAWRRRRGAELAQPIFELPVAELEFLVLAGQLPKLVFQPLDPHFQVGVVGLRRSLRGTLRRTLPRKRDLCER